MPAQAEDHAAADEQGGVEDHGRRLRSQRAAELRLRVASALVMVPAVLVALFLGGVWWLALVAAMTAGCMIEWGGLCRTAAAGAARTGGGLAVILLAGAALAWVRVAPHGTPGAGAQDALFLLIAVWASDIGAFAAGRAIGGPRLAPRISPGKTWSGAAGGLVAACLAGAAVAAWADGAAAAGAAAAACLSVAAQAGDLAESAAKRRFGVKDSGRLIPGHGGLLDRVDGLIVAAPVAAGLAMASVSGLVWGR